MSYSPSSPPTARDYVRLLIGDTGAGQTPAKAEMFTDDEVDMVLSVTGTTTEDQYAAAIVLLQSMHTNRARFAVAWSVMQQEANLDQRAVARELRLAIANLKTQAEEIATGDQVTWTDENLVELQDSLARAGFYDYQRQEDGGVVET